MKEAQFEDLVGVHTLDGADYVSEETLELLKTMNPDFEDASMLLFRLDGIVYLAVEDPEDGYRSTLGHIYNMGPGSMTNVFPPVRVRVDYVTEHIQSHGGKEECEVLRFMELLPGDDLGDVIMEVGTEDSNDYYPSCVMYFDASRLSYNKGK